MEKLIKVIKSWQIKRVFIVFLAGSLLIFSTACSQGKVTSLTKEVKSQLSDTSDKYDANQTPQEGMNVYNDDSRYENPEVQAKTKALVEEATTRTNQYDLEDSPERVTQKVQETLEQAKQEIPETLQETQEKVVQDIQQKTEPLQKNLENAPDELGSALDEAGDTLNKTIDDAAKATKETVKDVQENLQDLT